METHPLYISQDLKPIAGYGDTGAEMLAARFIAERMDRFEPWLLAQGLKSSFFQSWIEGQKWRAQQVLNAAGIHPVEGGKEWCP